MQSYHFSSLLNNERSQLPDQIANYILKKIFIGELVQDTRLIESNIAKELNVSNIPVREAFYILESRGVIERLPRRGVRVKAISEEEMADYTTALIELFRIGIDYSRSKWDGDNKDQLQQYLREAKEQLSQKNILEYVVKVHQLCGYVFQVAGNKAFIKFYSDITFITNVYSQMNWGDVERTKIRSLYLEELVNALVQDEFEKAKESFEILTRQSLTIQNETQERDSLQ
ncbi:MULTISPECIES: GntR family transcriptional regulator [unclassified Paenibacillus]|jgi:DNA-binding GntR family transcriptional regulator|uniref:GntR family transcriptional regulator n=1 Tax=unclassified Paenibacillus TaxID=185978 RepID=UPI00041225E5|nr:MULTISPECIES: GntR family transcriptional regulator [unclassified Paenibacillus]